MTWFPDARSCAIWGGPHFRFPFTAATFGEDTRFGDIPSCSLVGEGGELLAFGQYYERLGRCHLARLAVAPGRRGRGLGGRLVRELCALGCRQLAADECSLFVMRDNAPAVRLYEKLGFAVVPYPEEGFELEGADYMIAPLAAVLATGEG